MDILNELETFLAQAKSTRNLDGLKVAHIKIAAKEIARLRNEVFILRQHMKNIIAINNNGVMASETMRVNTINRATDALNA